MSHLVLDANALYRDLLRGVPYLFEPAAAVPAPPTHLVGITSGGAWLAEKLHTDLKLPGSFGSISSTLHRDDFAQRGLGSSGQTSLPFEVDGAHIIILDDVLYTGRTIRAVINELFDYGRPASVKLAVLVDRGGRQLPVQADFCAARVSLPADQALRLARNEGPAAATLGYFSFKLQTA